MKMLTMILQLLTAVALAPLLSGIIRKIKNNMRMRRGAGILQPYRNLAKLLSKGEVVSAERGGKTKTVMQLIAVGFLLFVPAMENDWARYLPFPIGDYGQWLHVTGLAIFIVATVLTVSSGVSYALKYRRVFSEK